MTDAAARRAARGSHAARISEQLPRRRRTLGLALVTLGVLALAAQGLSEWLLPHDLRALDPLSRLLPGPPPSAAQAVWAWAALCVLLLLVLARAGPRPVALALGCGLALGSAQVAAGGAAASLALLLLVGVASLGWQARREGGLALLLGTALAVSAWDAAQSDYPSLWAVAGVLALMFVWIDRQHIRASDRRLFDALAERDALIAQLDERSELLGELQRARTRLLASISHDLRQPLQAVRLFADALQARAAPGRRAAQADDDAHWLGLLRQQMRAADDATAMLDQFSEISAIEQGALQSHPERVDVRELLDGVAATLRAAHPESQLRLHVAGRRHGVWADRSQLSRVVQNLAGNAVRYSLGQQPGQPARVLLALRVQRAGVGSAPAVRSDGTGGGGLAGPAGLVIEVRDNGCGIPADRLQDVFEPYVQLAPVATGASRAGRGLGLAIVRGLVAQLGLQLAPVCTLPGRGTRVAVRVPPALLRELPVVAPEAAAGGAAGAAAGVAGGPGPVAPARGAAQPAAIPRAIATQTAATLADHPPPLDGWLLALLEDEEGPRAALRAALEGAGATVLDAPTLAQLQVLLDDEPRFPDALLLDLDLGPGQPDGLAALAGLRAAWDLAVPAVLVTGRIAALGTLPLPRACTLLVKPVALATLVATLRRVAPQAGRASRAEGR